MERKPDWLKVSYNPAAVDEIAQLMNELNLNTVCREANCPNIGECYRKHTATFMILGSHCTRNCRFCNVQCDAPDAVDPAEPANVAAAAKRLGLRHAVVTSVTRDDLPDGGATHFAAVIRAIREICPDTTVEVLVPDFGGDEKSLLTVLNAKPDVFNHNVETVEALYTLVRPQARYARSLEVLAFAKRARPEGLVKTGFMVGLGETDEQIAHLMDDVLKTGCDILTIGQYLRPSAEHAELKRYATPEDFARYRDLALQKGFRHVASAPLARSSYRAHEAVQSIRGEVI